jgi:hypothetical protein
VSHHLDLYRYWLAKRVGRANPARSDIDPVDIPALLPYLTIVDKVDGQFRYRLVGTAVVQQFGYDLTGTFIGLPMLRAIAERVFADHPLFVTGEYETPTGNIHNVSALALPLSDDGTNVNMCIFTRIAWFNVGVTASVDWLKGVPLKVDDVTDVVDVEDLEKRCLNWEWHCVTTNAAAKGLT